MAEENSSFQQVGNELIYVRMLNAPRDLVWEVWTEPEHIKEWFGPDGFTITHKTMEVQKGKQWKFTMHGQGQDFENKIEYLEVNKPSMLVYRHGDEEDDVSFMVYINFENLGDKTLLTMRSVFKSEEYLNEINRKFGAVEGGKQTLSKLDAYVSAQLKLRQQLKSSHMSRVSTYLNFAGKTEEAFNFYKSVFGGEFGGNGIQRFGQITPQEGVPPLSEAEKKLILHVELPIMGGHVLMATDAPESMGFKVELGNHMHISLEPDTRAETKRLFDALSAGGKVTMELKDMFWGAYYGSLTDKYGINWMVNCTQK
jgi:PhnB protein